MGGTGNLKITEGYLKDFANNKLGKFVDAIDPLTTTDASVTELAGYTSAASGSGSGSSSFPALDPSGGYELLLPGNPGALTSAGTLQGDFKTLTTTLSTQMQALVQASKNLSYDLLHVDDVLAKSDDDANITADEMSTDIANVNLSGSGSTGSTNTPNPTTPNPTGTGSGSGSGSGSGKK